MLESNNYYALYLAEYVGGDIQSFCDRMNQKALELGATNTHFMNPHGLHDENHYTTAYDLYLIFQNCIQNEAFLKIIETKGYTASITQADGNVRTEDLGADELLCKGDCKRAGWGHCAWWKDRHNRRSRILPHSVKRECGGASVHLHCDGCRIESSSL